MKCKFCGLWCDGDYCDSDCMEAKALEIVIIKDESSLSVNN